MKILALDTSTKVLALAIFDNGHLVSEKNLDSNVRHGDRIIPSIRKLFEESELDIGDIGGFIIGIGPGSFTGLRVGVSLIKGFCLGKKYPVLAIPSLDLIAYNARLYCKNICVILDAKQNKVYACFYKMNSKLRKASKYLLCSIDELIKRTQEFKGEILFIGDGLRLYKDTISRKLGDAIFAEEDFWFPKARALGALGWPRFKKYSTRDINKIKPLYLYPKECQIRKK